MEAWEMVDALLDSAVKDALFSNTALAESVVTVNAIWPTPGVPSGRVKVYWRARESPGRIAPLPEALAS